MICGVCGKNNLPEVTICEACGAALGGASSNTGALEMGAAVPYSPALKHGSALQNGAYKIGNVLGEGGFGITYKGGDMSLKRYVAIKELFVHTNCTRVGDTVQPAGTLSGEDYQNIKTKFLSEARTLAKFNHPGIVRVFGAWEENNTAYMAMELLDGESLQQRLNHGVMNEKDAVAMAVAIGGALQTIHEARLIHRDIKPDNIMLTKDGRTVLIDFGTAREFATGKTKAMTAMLTPGYAPLEQYGSQARFGVYSDIYALGATLYHCLTGQMPPPATDRAAGVELQSPESVNPNLSRNVSQAVMWALQVKASDRPQSVGAWLEALRAQGKTSVIPGQERPGQSLELSSPSSSTSGVWVKRAGEAQRLTNASAEVALDALYRAFQNSGVANLQVDERNFSIVGNTGASMQSRGQRVTGQISTASQGLMVQVGSQALGIATDLGRGKAEAQTILTQFEHIIKGGVPAPPPVNAPPLPSPFGGTPPSGSRYPGVAINNSGQGAASVLPMELRGFNGGAFFLAGIWGFSNGAVGWSLAMWLMSWIPGVNILTILIAIYLGSNGSEMAWKNRRWESIDQFKEVQKIWQNWGVGLFCASLLIGFLIAAGSN